MSLLYNRPHGYDGAAFQTWTAVPEFEGPKLRKPAARRKKGLIPGSSGEPNYMPPCRCRGFSQSVFPSLTTADKDICAVTGVYAAANLSALLASACELLLSEVSVPPEQAVPCPPAVAGPTVLRMVLREVSACAGIVMFRSVSHRESRRRGLGVWAGYRSESVEPGFSMASAMALNVTAV
jgi:hypothetical protein